MKLINTKEYLLLIDEEAEIEEGGYFYWNLEHDSGIGFCSHINKESLRINDDFLNCRIKEIGYGVFSIVAYRKIKEAKGLDLPSLPNPFKEVVDLKSGTNIQLYTK